LLNPSFKNHLKFLRNNFNFQGYLPKKPKVSVIIITYNHSSYISSCLESVLNQITNFTVECLVGDDFSSDGTSSIISNFEEQNKDLIFHIRRNTNLGQLTGNGRLNLLHTLSLAKGEFIAICEGDDYWTDPHKLQKQVDYLQANPECSICSHWIKTKDESGQGIHEDAFASMERKNPLYKDDLFIDDYQSPHGTAYHPLSWMFRSELVKSIPDWIFPIKGGDDVLFTEFLQHGYCHCIPEFMGTYRITKKSSWAPLDARTKSLAQLHFLHRVKMHYPIYKEKVIILIKKHLNDWKNWPANKNENLTIFKQMIVICKNDLRVSIPMVIFCMRVWAHQFYFNSSGVIRICLGKWKSKFSHTI
jgi:glycosyltransferase involved in cell wall biosynthesis